MAVSVTSRPSTWSAVKVPLVYKFTSTGHGALTNYRIEVEVFKASDDSSLTDGVKFSFSPDPSGVTYADISTIIKVYLKAEWIKPSNLNEVESDTSLKFYIKYQELYDGSATSVVDDVANPRYAVFAGLQIPSANGNNLTDYVPADNTKKFLTMFENPKLWRGYPATLSFIFPEASGLWVSIKQYNSAGQLLSESLRELEDSENGSVNRLRIFDEFTILNDATKTVKVQLKAKENILNDSSFESGIGGGEWTSEESADEPNNPWTNGTAQVTVPLDDSGVGDILYSENLTQVLDTEYPAGDYVLKVNASGSYIGGLAPTNTRIWLYNSGVAHPVEAYDSSANEYPLVAGDIEFAFEAFLPFDEIRIQVRRLTPDSNRSIVYNSAELLQTVDRSEELTLAVEDPCNNPVLLVWKNSLGGDAWWMFDYDQERRFATSGQAKAKRDGLFAGQLTANQWEVLNELTHLGEVTRENILEFTASVNKSHVKDGAQVYTVDADGNKIGVIIIPKNNVMFTRMIRHQFGLEVEYPERYE